MKKIKHTFGTYYNEMTMETFVEVDEIVKDLATTWGEVPRYIKRAYEIHSLAKGYMALQRECARLQNKINKLETK